MLWSLFNTEYRHTLLNWFYLVYTRADCVFSVITIHFIMMSAKYPINRKTNYFPGIQYLSKFNQR